MKETFNEHALEYKNKTIFYSLILLLLFYSNILYIFADKTTLNTIHSYYRYKNTSKQ